MSNSDPTIKAYNLHAQEYAAKFMSFPPYSKRMQEFIELLSKRSLVLDLGCGPGNMAKILIDAGKSLQVTGIDLSGEMIEAARLTNPTGEFRVEDIRQAIFPAQYFDAVIMSFCIVHLSDDEAYALINRAAQWLKPAGLLYLSFMQGKKPGLESTSFSPHPIYFNYFDGCDMESRLQQAGFSILRSVRQDYTESDGSITKDVFLFARNS